MHFKCWLMLCRLRWFGCQFCDHMPRTWISGSGFLYAIRFSISLVIYYYVDFPQIIVIYFGHVLTSRMPWFYHIVPMKFGTCVQHILQFVIHWSMNHFSIRKRKYNEKKPYHIIYIFHSLSRRYWVCLDMLIFIYLVAMGWGISVCVTVDRNTIWCLLSVWEVVLKVLLTLLDLLINSRVFIHQTVRRITTISHAVSKPRDQALKLSYRSEILQGPWANFGKISKRSHNSKIISHDFSPPIFCLSFYNDVCNSILYWSALSRHSTVIDFPEWNCPTVHPVKYARGFALVCFCYSYIIRPRCIYPYSSRMPQRHWDNRQYLSYNSEV